MSLIIGIFLWIVASRACVSATPRIVLAWALAAGGGIPLLGLLDGARVAEACVGMAVGVPIAFVHLLAVSRAGGIAKWLAILIIGTVAYFACIALAPDLVLHRGDRRATAATAR